MKKQLKTNIYSLAFGGKGIGKIDGKVCFVKGALPGEEVVFNVIRNTSRYVEGEVSKIIVSSKDRVDPVCPYYSRCGGCNLQHISYEKELFYKKEQLTQLMRRISGQKNFMCKDIIAREKCYNYRSSITLHRKGANYGYYNERSHFIIVIDKCPIADEAINKELMNLRERAGKKRITLKTDYYGKVWSSDVTGERFFLDRYRDVDVYMSPKVFSQVNRYIAEKIAGILEEWIGPVGNGTAFFDLYCGTGFFSFLLKQNFCFRIGLDTDRLAITCAKSTVRRNGFDNIKFYKSDVKKGFFDVFKKNKKRCNILFADPPRTGIDKTFLKKAAYLEELDRLYYLSCDPACLARDIKVLTDSGAWRLNRVLPFDMFPRTKHIETLTEFVRI